MKRSLLVAAFGLVSLGLAQEAGASSNFFAWTDAVSILALAIAVFGCALAQGNAISKALEGIARQPEAGGRLRTVMIIGLAFIESLTIYVLVIALILQSKLPDTKTILDILTRGLGGG